MTEIEVSTILVRNLETNESTNEALVLSQRDIGFKLIADLACGSLDESFIRTLKTTVEVHSEFAFFKSLMDVKTDNMVVGFSVQYLSRFLAMYEKFGQIFRFLYEHYDDMYLAKYATSWPKESVKEFAGILDRHYESYSEEFRQSGCILLNINDLNVVYRGVSLVYMFFLGEEKFQQFMREFNSATAILRKMQVELKPPSLDVIE